MSVNTFAALDHTFFNKDAFLEFISSDQDRTEAVYPGRALRKEMIDNGIFAVIVGPKKNGDAGASCILAIAGDSLLLVKQDVFDRPEICKEWFGEEVCEQAWRDKLSHKFFLYLKDELFTPECLNTMVKKNLLFTAEKAIHLPNHRKILSHLDDPDWLFTDYKNVSSDSPISFSFGEIVKGILDDFYFEDVVFKDLRDQVMDPEIRNDAASSYLCFLIKLKLSADVVREILNGRAEESRQMCKDLRSAFTGVHKVKVFFTSANGTEKSLIIYSPFRNMYPFNQSGYFFGFRTFLTQDSPEWDPVLIRTISGPLLPWTNITQINNGCKILWRKR